MATKKYIFEPAHQIPVSSEGEVEIKSNQVGGVLKKANYHTGMIKICLSNKAKLENTLEFLV